MGDDLIEYYCTEFQDETVPEEISLEKPQSEHTAFDAVRKNDQLWISRCLHHDFHVDSIHRGTDGICEIKVQSQSTRNVRLKGYALLHVAACHGTIQTVELLIQSGANVNLLDENKRSPLSLAVIFRRPDVVSRLIRAGADVNSQSVSGRTPLIEAVTNNDLIMTKLLIQARADVDMSDLKQVTPLLTAIGTVWPNGVQILKTLLKAGCKVDYRNKQGATPLMSVISLRRFDMAQMLLDAGADINAMDKFGKVPFHFAHGFQTAKFLLNNGATCDSPDKQGIRPLDQAVANGNGPLIFALLNAESPRSMAIIDAPRVEIIRKVNKDFDCWLYRELYNPRELRRLCRETIRSQLSPSNTCQIQNLPIPALTKDFLLLKHLDLNFNS